MCTWDPISGTTTDSSYGAIWAEGEGTFKDGVADMMIEFYVPGVGSWGEFNEIITLP